MTCIKTGCHIYIEPYDEYAYGDAFSVEITDENGRPAGEVFWFRICDQSRDKFSPVLHFTVHDFENWFDLGRSSQTQNSTLVSTSVTNHGYEGKPL